MFNRKVVLTSLILLLLSGCASNENALEFDSGLYAGVPVDSLTSEDPPESEKEAITRADTALSLQKYDLALYEYIRSLGFPDGQYQDQSLYNIGLIHQSRGNTVLAEKAFLRTEEVNPEHAGALEQLGVMYAKSGRIIEGRNYLMKAVNVDQKRLEGESELSNFDLLTEEEVSGLSVDALSPIRCYMGLGVLSDLQARYDIAKRFYEKGLEIDPRSVDSMINLGYSHYMSGNYHIAKRLMTTALQYQPNNEKAQNNLALIHLALGETTRALNVFMRQMEAPEALNNVGYFLILQGKPEEAVPYLQQAIDKKASYYKLANENLTRALAEIRAKKLDSEYIKDSKHKIEVVKP